MSQPIGSHMSHSRNAKCHIIHHINHNSIFLFLGFQLSLQGQILLFIQAFHEEKRLELSDQVKEVLFIKDCTKRFKLLLPVLFFL